MPDRRIEPHIPALRRYAWGLCRHAQDADDLVQDCLTRALERWHLRRPDGNVRAWLYTILHNTFISDRRREKRRLQGEAYDELLVHATQEHRLMLDDVGWALGLLPEEQQAVLLLVAVEDFSYAEAAKILGLPIGTVMSRLSRGRERMRQSLDGSAAGARKLRRVK